MTTANTTTTSTLSFTDLFFRVRQIIIIAAAAALKAINQVANKSTLVPLQLLLLHLSPILLLLDK